MVKLSDWVVVTGADRTYFSSLVSLLESLSRHDTFFDCKIFDLGLLRWQKQWLQENLSQNFELTKLPKRIDIFTGWDEVKERDCYAWKPIAIEEASKNYIGLFWLDAGVMLTSNLSTYCEYVENNGALIFKNYNHTNRDWTSQKCIDVMKVSKLELDSSHVMANFIGLSLTNKLGIKLLQEWVHWSKNEKAIKGQRISHRHDQTILSILAARMNINLMSFEKITAIARFHRDYKQAESSGMLFIAHRRWLLLNPIQILRGRKIAILEYFTRTFFDRVRIVKIRSVWRVRWSRPVVLGFAFRANYLNWKSQIRS